MCLLVWVFVFHRHQPLLLPLCEDPQSVRIGVLIWPLRGPFTFKFTYTNKKNVYVYVTVYVFNAC